MPVKSHWHYFTEVLYLQEGSLLVSCNDSVYHIKPGSFILFPPQTVHALAADQDRPFRYFCIKFNLNRIQLTGSYLPNLSFAFHKIATMTYPSLLFTQEDLSELNLHDFFVTLEREALEKKYGYDAYIYSLFSTLFLRLLRIWHCQGICFNPESISESEEQSMQDILVYLDRHSQENINIEALAHKYNMSYSYFAKLFLKHYGQSCKQYIEFILSLIHICGGSVGLDVIEYFAPRGAECTIIDMLPQIGMLADPITKCSMRETHDKYGVKEYVNTALQEVKENAFTVKLPDGTIQDLTFDYGFNCLGMRSNNPILPELQEAFADTHTYIYTIGDSVRARRIMEGTMEGRAILNVLESQGYLHLEPLE